MTTHDPNPEAGRQLTSEELITYLAEQITSLLVDDPIVELVCDEIAVRECVRLYERPNHAWTLSEAAERMHPSENHYWSIRHQALVKAMALSIAKMRYFSDAD
jgi:hypothetical protein